MNENASHKQDTATPFEQFEDLARRLFAVPKRELDEKRPAKQDDHDPTVDTTRTDASEESLSSDSSSPS